MKKRILCTIFFIIILIANLSLASYNTVTMSVVEEPICEIKLGENSKFQKQIISKDLNNKEVTLQLKVTNEDEAAKPTGELVLVLDNSRSTSQGSAAGASRKELIYNSSKTLVSNLLKDNTSLKVGVVAFSAKTSEFKDQGTIEDAFKVCDLSNDSSTIASSISNIPEKGNQTNLEAGLELATTLFTKEDNNKYIVLLTDGIPNLSIFEETATAEQKYYYSDYTIDRSNKKLKSIADSNINLITMLTGIDNPQANVTGTTKTYSEIITETFGTSENPTAGKFYYITDEKIEETITTDIYNSLVPTNNTLKDITIVDYFPEEIVKNFEFAYVTNSNIGTISPNIDTVTNSITWTIPELKYGETAIVEYKLKLKKDFDSSIIDKILNTNQKVDINYKDFDGNTQTKTSDISPKIKLTEPQAPVTPKAPPKELPKAGTVAIIGFIALAGGISLFSLIKLLKINNKMK